jgi:excisionase family DNA binding protein
MTTLRTNGHADVVLDDWFDRTGAAEYAGVSVRTIDRWIADGDLGAFRRSNGTLKLHKADLDRCFAAERLEPLSDVYDRLTDETVAALRKALPRLRREAPGALAALFAAMRYGDE